jgi:hypothetical protein
MFLPCVKSQWIKRIFVASVKSDEHVPEQLKRCATSGRSLTVRNARLHSKVLIIINVNMGVLV